MTSKIKIRIADAEYCHIGTHYFADRKYLAWLWEEQRKRDDQRIINNMGQWI